MATKIRLKRMGKIRHAFYRVVVVDSRKKRDGEVIEEIGTYDPNTQPSTIKINSERAQYWLGVGAQPSDPLLVLLKITGDWQKAKGLPGAEGTLRTPEGSSTNAQERVAEADSQAQKLKATKSEAEAKAKKEAEEAAAAAEKEAKEAEAAKQEAEAKEAATIEDAAVADDAAEEKLENADAEKSQKIKDQDKDEAEERDKKEHARHERKEEKEAK